MFPSAAGTELSFSTSGNFACSISTNNAGSTSQTSITTSVISSSSTESNIAYCQLNDLNNMLVAGGSYRLTITLTGTAKITSSLYKSIGLFTSTSNLSDKIILDSNPYFGELAVYNDFVSATAFPFTFSAVSLTTTATPPATTVPIYSAAQVNFQFSAINTFVGPNYTFVVQWDSSQLTGSSVNLSSPTVATTVTNMVQYVPSTGAVIPTPSPFPLSTSTNAISFSFQDTFNNRQPYTFQLKGFTATDTFGSKNINFFLYYKNTYTVVSYLSQSVSTAQGTATLTVSAFDSMPISMGGSWNLSFNIATSSALPNAFYVVLQHTNYALGSNKVNFIASTCDFQDSITSAVGGLSNSISATSQTRPVCFPLRMDFAFTGTNGSGIIFKFPSITASTANIAFNVFVFCEQCGAPSTTSPVFLNTNSVNLGFTATLYKSVDQTRINENRLSNQIVLAATPAATISCSAAYTLGYSGKGFLDITDAYNNIAGVTGTSSTSGTYVYRDINDFYLPFISNVSYSTNNTASTVHLFTALNGNNGLGGSTAVTPTIVFGNIFSGTSTTNRLTGATNSYLAVLATVLLGNLSPLGAGTDTLIASGGYLCNYIACAIYGKANGTTKITLTNMPYSKLQFSFGNTRNWFIAGDTTNCYFSWGFSLFASVANPVGSLTAPVRIPGFGSKSGVTTVLYDNQFSTQFNLFNTASSGAADTAASTVPAGATGSAPTSITPQKLFNIIGQSRGTGEDLNDLPTIVGGKIVTFTNKSIAASTPVLANANLGFLFPDAPGKEASGTSSSNTALFALLNTCVKWNTTTPTVTSPYWYVDIQLNVQECTSTSSACILSRVNRFMKFVVDSGPLDFGKTTPIQTAATALTDYNMVFHGVNFAQPTITAPNTIPSFAYNSVCLIQIDTSSVYSISSTNISTSNVLLVSLSNLMILETDLTDVSSTYPTSAGTSFGFNAVPSFVSQYKGSTWGGNYPWYLYDYGNNGQILDDGTNGTNPFTGISSAYFASMADPTKNIPLKAPLTPAQNGPRSIHKLFLGASVWVTYSGAFNSAFPNDLLIPTYCPIVSTVPSTVAKSQTPAISGFYSAPLVQLNFLTASGFTLTTVDFQYAAPSNSAGQGCGGSLFTGAYNGCSGSYFSIPWSSSFVNSGTTPAAPTGRPFQGIPSAFTNDFGVATILRWNSYSATTNTNSLNILANNNTLNSLATGTSTVTLSALILPVTQYRTSAYILFASSAVADDSSITTTRGFSGNFYPSGVTPKAGYYNGSTNSKFFFVNGSKFNRGYLSSVHSGTAVTPSGSYGNLSGTSNTFIGLAKPSLSSSLILTSTGTAITLVNSVAFYAVSDGATAPVAAVAASGSGTTAVAAVPAVTGDYNYFSNYFNGSGNTSPSSSNGDFFNFWVDLPYSSTTSTSSSIAPTLTLTFDNSADKFAADTNSNINIKVTFPTAPTISVPGSSIASLKLTNSLFNSNTLCGIVGSTATQATDCSNNAGTISCPFITSETSGFTVCCYGVALGSATVFQTVASGSTFNIGATASANFAPSAFNSNFYFIESGASTTVNPSFSLTGLPTTNTLAAFKATISPVTYPSLFHPGAFSKVVFQVGLPRALARGSTLTITGDFTSYVPPTTFNGSLRCIVNTGTTPKYLNGDGWIQRCNLNWSSAQGTITITTSNSIYACGSNLGQSLYISVWPVVANIPVTTKLYTIQNAFGSTNLYVAGTGDALQHSLSASTTINGTATNLTTPASITPVVTINNPIIGQYGDYAFNFNLSTLTSAAVSQEFHIFFPYPLYNIISAGFNSQIYCTYTNGTASPVVVPCGTVEENWVRVYAVATNAINQIITISGIPNPIFPATVSFAVQTAYLDPSNNRIVQFVGISTYTSTTETATGGILSIQAITPTNTEPRIATSSNSINIRVGIDTLFVSTTPYPITLANGPVFIVTLPFPDYNLIWYKGLSITATVTETDAAATATASPTKVQYSLGTLQILGNKIVIPLTATATGTITIPALFQFWEIVISGIPQPNDQYKVSTGRFRVAITNSAVGYVYRDYSNLSLANNAPLTANFDLTSQNLIVGTRGITYNYLPSKFVVDVTNCSPTSALTGSPSTNFIYVRPGRAATCYFTVRSGTYTAIPDSINISLTGSNFVMSPSTVSLFTSLNAVPFMIGAPCLGNYPGTYYVTFTTSGSSNFYPIPPVPVFIDGSASVGSVTAPTIPDIAQGGEFPFTLALSDIPVDTLSFSAVQDPTQVSPDPKATIPSTITVSAFNSSVNSMFTSLNATYFGNAQWRISYPTTLYSCWGSATPISLNFKIGQATTQAAVTSSYNFASSIIPTVDSIIKNQVNVAFTPPLSPVYLYCVIACVYTNFPSDIRNTSSLNTPIYQYYQTYVGSTSQVKFSFTGLSRGQSYKMRCALSNTFVASTGLAVVSTNDIITAANPLTLPFQQTGGCVQFASSNVVPSVSFTDALLRYCQNFFSYYKISSTPNPPTAINPACIICQDDYRNYTLGIRNIVPTATRCANTAQTMLRFLQTTTPTTTTTTTNTTSSNSTNVTVLPSYMSNVCIWQNRVCPVDNLSGTDNLATALAAFYSSVRLLNAPLAKLINSPLAASNITTLPVLNSDNNSTTNFSVIVNSAYYIRAANSTALYLNVTSKTPLQCYYYLNTNNGPAPSIATVNFCGNTTICGNFRVGSPVSNFTVFNLSASNLVIPTNINVSLWGVCKNDIAQSLSSLGLISIWNFTGTNNNTGNAPAASTTPSTTPSTNPTTSTNPTPTTTTNTTNTTTCPNGTVVNGTTCNSALLTIAKWVISLLALIMTISI